MFIRCTEQTSFMVSRALTRDWRWRGQKQHDTVVCNYAACGHQWSRVEGLTKYLHSYKETGIMSPDAVQLQKCSVCASIKLLSFVALHPTPKETHGHGHTHTDTHTDTSGLKRHSSRRLAAYQQFIHTSLTFFQIDAFDGHLFLSGLAECSLHNGSGTTPWGEESTQTITFMKPWLGTSIWYFGITPFE